MPLLVLTNDSVETSCALGAKYLQFLISNKTSYLQTFGHSIEESVSVNINDQDSCNETSNDECGASFTNCALLIANNCKLEMEKIEGEYDDNAQYIPELVPFIIKAMKLYPCWVWSHAEIIFYGDTTVSSSHVERYFNQFKNRAFEGDNLPIRVDDFEEKLTSYSNGDNLLL